MRTDPMGKFCHPEKRSVVGQCEGVCRSIAFVRDDALYGKSKTPSEETLTGFWCPGQESNLHASRHTHLKRARLPIPPPGHHGITVCKSNTFFLNANILGRFFRKKLLVEVFIVKNQQINHGYRDISIGQVENCTEEVVAAIDQEIEESGNAVPLKERKTRLELATLTLARLCSTN